MRRRRDGWSAASRSLIAMAGGGLLIVGLTSAASAAPQAGSAPGVARALTSGPAGVRPAPHLVTKPHALRLPAGERLLCGVPSQPGQMACQAVVQAGPAGLVPASTSAPGYSPASLRSAYDLTSASLHRGKGETVAIVDAYSNPNLARNLASYRSHFHLPACSQASHCLRIVNQSGKSGPLPGRSENWGLEESLDLDMVSAICPRCHILLVEAKSSSTGNLGIAENTAVAKGARFVSNSWSGDEFIGQDAFDHYFNHPGVAIAFAAGDFGYGTLYPTDTQYVTAVGGTALVHRRSGGRAWTESAWGSTTDTFGGTGSGCSALEAKPSWQHADNSASTGCLNRTENDVSADAELGTGVAVYDTYRTGGTFFKIGGTSVATPIITSVYALAGNPARGTYPASYPYQHASDFNDVKSGLDGRCEPARQYLCHGKRGYDGPTGLGTPKGTAGFSSHGVHQVTVLDPGTQDVTTGAGIKLTVRAVDSDSTARSLSYSVKPSTLKISSAPHSLNGVLTGTLATAGGTKVTVTAKDRRTGRSGSTQFEVYAIGSMTASAANTPAPGLVKVSGGRSCLSAAAETAGAGVVTQPCGKSGVFQDWQFISGTRPGSAGTVRTASGTCLGLTSGHKALLQTCGGAAAAQWEYQLTETSSGQLESLLFNPASRLCLNGGSLSAGNRVVGSACSTAGSQNWALGNTALVSGLANQCLSFSGSSPGITTCAPADPQQSWLPGGGNLRSTAGCLAINGQNDGTRAVLESCAAADNMFEGVWVAGPAGELIDGASGKCLDAVGGHAQLEDCYGQPGEIWALN